MAVKTSRNMIRVSKSVIGKEEISAVTNVLKREKLGMGSDVEEFEAKLSLFFNRQVACVNTGTAALQLALQAIGVGYGDEVLVQSLTYVATFQAISACGALPISCEITDDTFTIDLTDARKKISKRTKAIVPVHYSGEPGNFNEILSFGKEFNIRVVEDAAHAFGTIYNGQKIGSFGDITCFSFDGIKNITCGEGGAIVTNDSDVIRKIQDIRLLGVINDTQKRYSGERSWAFNVTDQGWRFHMSNIMAAIGIEQLKKIDLFKKKRQYLATKYQNAFKKHPAIKLLNIDYSQVVPHIFVIRIMNGKRDIVKQYLKDNHIETGIHYLPNHLLSKYAKPIFHLPLTEKIYSEILTLPLHPDLTISDVSFVIAKLKFILNSR
jgi:dTDP-4-amino-4,6-dideoxygalactose transaminase